MQRIFRCLFVCKPNFINEHVSLTCRFSTGVVCRDSSNETCPSKPANQPIADFYAGRSIFLTGATGFIGRLMIERLLFTCKDIEKLYVLIRPKKDASAQHRLEELFENPIFKKLKQTRPDDLSKVVAISGDVVDANLGITSEDEQTLVDKVSVVFHSAAQVRFTEPTTNHLQINYEGTKKVMDLGKRMKNLDIFVYVSTAFDNSKNVIEEIIYPAPRKIEDVYKVIEKYGDNPKEIRKQLLDKQGNSYIFSKKMSEAYVTHNHGEMPTIIVKPSMVSSVFNEPLPGYTDSWVAGTGLLCDIASGITRVIYGYKRVVVDFIPVDYVCNFLIIAAARNSRTKECNVYNIATSHANPINWQTIIEMYIKEGKKNGYVVMPFPFVVITEAKWAMPLLIFTLQTLPSFVADTWLRLTGRRPRYMTIQKRSILLIDLAESITNTSWLIKTSRTQQLISTLDDKDRKTFICDPSTIDWGKYIPIFCKGVKQYMLGNKNFK